MRKYYAIFLISIFLLSTTQFSELLKLPDLIQHFQEHKQWDDSISFADFLYRHYVEDGQQYPDKDRDMEMPFKVISTNAMGMVSFLITPAQDFLTPVVYFQSQRKKLYHHDFFYSSFFQNNIWQPPRNC